ncbi:MAG: hypothetical protein WCK09_17360, partial [Bacteroidota bacterium]
PPSAPFAGVDQKLCTTSPSTTLTGNTPVNGTGVWSQVAKPVGGVDATIATPNNATTTVTLVTPGTYTFAWTITNGACGSVQDLVEVSLYTPCVVTAGADATICRGGTYTLTGTASPDCGTLGWGTNGDGFFNDPSFLSPVYTPGPTDIANGSVVLYIQCASCCGIPCAAGRDEMTLKIVTVNAGADATVCSSAASYTLSGAATNQTSVLWSTSGTGTFAPATPNTLNAAYYPSAADKISGSVNLTLTAFHTGSNACSVYDDMVLHLSTATATASTLTNVFCHGQATGVAKVTSGGGTPPYTFLWSNGMTNGTINGLTAGTYTVTVTDASGCTATSSTLVTQPANVLAAGISSQTNPSCNGGSNGVVTVTASGGTSPYTFKLNDGIAQSSGTFNNLGAGNYNILVTDANGCAYYLALELVQPTQLVAQIIGSTNVTCFNSANGTATVNPTGGTTDYTYTWSTSPAQTAAMATGLSQGTYTVTVSDAHSCTATASVVITSPSAALAITGGTITNPTCNGSQNGNIDITVTGGTTLYSYAWSNGYNAQDPSGLSAGSYTVIVTDAHGCTATHGYTLTDPAALTLTVTNIVNTQCNASVGSVTLSSGSVTGTFTVNGVTQSGVSVATFTGLAAGYYTATFTASNGCTATAGFNIINQNSTLAATVSFTEPLCFGGTVTAIVTATGGTIPYTYYLNGGTSFNNDGIFSDLPAGSYNVLVKDLLGCTYTLAFDIDQPALLMAQIVHSTNVTCNGGLPDGTATVNATGGTSVYTYLWSNTQTTAMATGLTTGTYTVIVTDAHSCTAITSVLITQPTVVTANGSTVTNVSCYGNATGVAIVAPGGGTSPYNYLWSNGSTDMTAVGLSVGTYSVTVIDHNGCTATSSAAITQPSAPLTATIISSTNPGCEGASTGSATVSAGGGTGTYTYLWTNGQTTPTATGLAAGYYQVVVTDANGCTKEATVLLIDATGVTATIISTVNVSCNGLSDGQATVSASGGSGSYTYLWNDAQHSATATGLSVGQYTVTVTGTGPGGCTAIAMATITQPTTLIAQIVNSTNVTCNGLSNGTATVNATGGTTDYTYLWNNTQTAAMATGLTAGTYTVTVSDAHNCKAITSVLITQPTVVTASGSTLTNVLCYGNATGVAIVAPGGGTSPYNYLWSNGSTDMTAVGLSVGTYSVTVIDHNGCTATSSAAITQPSAPLTATIISSTNPGCEGASTGSATVSAGGGTGTYTYLWTNGQTTPTATGLAAGYYQVVVTDANGCTKEATVLLIDATGVTATIISTVNVSCNGLSDGQATVSASGGSGSYTYLWNDAQHSATATGLSVGQYTVTVTGTGPGGCTAIAMATITQPTTLIAQIVNSTNVTCNGLSNGTATVNATGGTTDYTYLWNNAQTTATATGLTAGTYTVTVSDAHSCTAITSLIITQPSVLTISASVNRNVNCYGGSDGIASATVSGGTQPFIVTWSNGSFGTVITGLPAGTFTVTVSDAHNCTSTASVIVTQPAGPITSLAGVDAAICTSDGQYHLNGQAVHQVSILWTTSGTGTFDNTASLTAFYTPSTSDITTGQVQLTLTAYGNPGCNPVSDFMVLTISKAAVTYAGPDAAICAGNSFILTGATAANYASLNWSTSGTGTFITPGSLNPIYIPSAADITTGLVTLTLTATGLGTCLPFSNEMLLTITSAPTSDAGPNATICTTAGSYPLNGSVTNAASVLWATSGTGIFTPGNTTLAATYHPSPADIATGQVQITLTAIGNGTCGRVTDEMTLTIWPGASADAGPDATICQGSTFVLTGATASHYASLTWSGGTGSFDNNHALNPTYTPGIGETGDVTLTLTAAGLGTCSNFVDNMTLTISTPPTLVTAGPDAVICETAAPYTISGSNAIDYTSVLWTTDGTGTFTDATQLHAIYHPSASDIEDVQVILTMTVTGVSACPVQVDHMVLTIWKQVTAFAGQDSTVCANTGYHVTDAHATNYTTVAWTITAGTGTLTGANTLAPIYTPGLNEIGNVILTLTAQPIGTCPQVTDQVTIHYKPCAIIANDDLSAGNIPGHNAVLNILANDKLYNGATPGPSEVTVDIDLTTPGVQNILVVPGEGTWTYNTVNGELTFDPQTGFTTDPTPITYLLTEISTGLSDPALVTVLYTEEPPIANDDVKNGNTPGVPAFINILLNDKLSDGSPATPANTSVQLIDPVTGYPTITANVVVVPNQGTWTYEPATGVLTFDPLPGFTTDPTPLNY